MGLTLEMRVTWHVCNTSSRDHRKVAAGSSSTAHLTLKDFPSEFENVYLPTCSQSPTIITGLTLHDRPKCVIESCMGIQASVFSIWILVALNTKE